MRGAEDDFMRSPQERAYQQRRREENEMLDRRWRAQERLEMALEELSRSWGWDDLSRQLRECEQALREARAVLSPQPIQLQLVPDSPSEDDCRMALNGA